MKNHSLPKHLILLPILFSLILAGCGNGTAAPFDINSLDIKLLAGFNSTQSHNLFYSAVSERQGEKYL